MTQPHRGIRLAFVVAWGIACLGHGLAVSVRPVAAVVFILLPAQN
jgi:hypothetical protein